MRYNTLDLLFVQLHALRGQVSLLFVHFNHQAKKEGAGRKLWILTCSRVELLDEAVRVRACVYVHECACIYKYMYMYMYMWF